METLGERNLLGRGFDLEDTVTAANKDGAVALCLRNTSTMSRKY